jgi:hypothetical protein
MYYLLVGKYDHQADLGYDYGYPVLDCHHASRY